LANVISNSPSAETGDVAESFCLTLHDKARAPEGKPPNRASPYEWHQGAIATSRKIIEGNRTAMTYKYPSPEVTIRRYPASPICDVVVVVRGQEVVLRCPSYSPAVKWARLECKSYKNSRARDGD